MPGITFLFWNLDKRSLETRVARIAASRGVDVVILCECTTPGDRVVAALTAAGAGSYHEADDPGRHLRVYSGLRRRALTFQSASPHKRWLIYRLAAGFAPEFLLAVAHLPSKADVDARTQFQFARTFAADISRVEGRRKHARTVVVGDLNMNPFEEGVAGADALHGVMEWAATEREARVIQGVSYRMFYNPMWGLLGDRTPGPPGTYYRSAAEAVNYFWNTYDQVLLRPSLAGRLDALEVLTGDGSAGLLTPHGLPDRQAGSDHLPLLFRITWEGA